jgi:hypothetical protein
MVDRSRLPQIFTVIRRGPKPLQTTIKMVSFRQYTLRYPLRVANYVFSFFLGPKRPQIVASSPALLHCLTASGQTMEKGAQTTIFLRKINISAPFSIDFALSKIDGEGSGMRR